MLKNYLTIALRNIFKHKGSTFLNIAGLSIGISACLLILSYVMYELSYDKFNEHHRNIYRVQLNNYQGGVLAFQCAAAYPAVGPSLKEEFPEIKEFVRLYPIHGIVSYNDIYFREEKVFYSDPGVFEIFTFSFIKGRKEIALIKPKSAAVSEKIAKKYFGSENPVGKIIKYNGREEYEVKGVFKDFPLNSHIKIDLLFSNERLYESAENLNENWRWYDFNTYILLKPGTNADDLQKKLPDFVKRNTEEKYKNLNLRAELILQPLTDIHLYSNLLQESEVNGNGNTIYFLMIIAFFILLIAWVNYINLTTARSVERAKEVGVRKVLGAFKTQLIQQFLFESVILNIVSMGLSLVIIEIVMPYFNQLAGKGINLSFTDYELWVPVFLFFIGGLFISAIYPSIILSSFRPQFILMGAIKRSENKISFRKILVVFQFASSIALIAGTLIVYNQVDFMKSQNLGVDINQTLVVRGPKIFSNDSLRAETITTFKNEVKNYSDVKSVSVSTNIPGDEIFWTHGTYILGRDRALKIIYIVGVDYDYFSSYDINFAAGRNFSEEYPSDKEYGGIINEEALKLYNFNSPEEALNNYIIFSGDSVKIIGVVKDYHQMSLQKVQNPMVFVISLKSFSFASFKVNTAGIEETIDQIEKQYSHFFPGNPFEHFFLDEFYNKQYLSEVQFGKIFGTFSLLAIIVACIGLFGLSSFSAVQRTKEIGIRKVLGASVINIVSMLSKEFIILVAVANLIAWPVAYYIMNSWLNDFAYRIEIGVGVFLAAGVAVLFVSLLTVAYQSVKVAVANPVKSLKYE